MSMITEQVERLRTLADITKDIADNSIDTVKTLREAADTIEQLAAIKTLEQEPCPDAISRQAAIDAMYALCNTGETLKENPWRDNPHIDAITDAIENLPSVNPQPKTGHWITKPHIYGVAFCSECDFELRIDDTKYCPNCGAKMVEPQERSNKE